MLLIRKSINRKSIAEELMFNYNVQNLLFNKESSSIVVNIVDFRKSYVMDKEYWIHFYNVFCI